MLPVAILILIVGFIATHLVADWVERRYTLAPTGLQFVTLGILAGPLAEGGLGVDLLAELAPIANTAVGLIGLQLGLALELRKDSDHADGVIRAGLVYSVVVLLVLGCAVYLALQLGLGDALDLRTRWLTALTLAATGLSCAPFVLRGLLRHRTPGPLADAAGDIGAVAQVVAILIFGLIVVPGETLTLATLALGALLGVALGALVGDETDPRRLFLGVLGGAALGSGLAHVLQLSPLLLNLVAGFTLANLGRSPVRLRKALADIEYAVYAALLVFAGAWWLPPDGWPAYVIVVGYVVFRPLAHGLAGSSAARTMKLTSDGATRLGMTLVGQGPLAVALYIDLALDESPAVPLGLVGTATLASLLLSHIWATPAARAVLVEAGELPAQVTPDPDDVLPAPAVPSEPSDSISASQEIT